MSISNRLVLSLFPGADLLGRAFELAGFCVVRGPDALLGGDIHDFSPPAGVFEGVIGGPPCQSFSRARWFMGNDRVTQGNLIPEFERVVREAAPNWFVMENVPAAPKPQGAVWSRVLDAHDYGSAQHRQRRFSSNLMLLPLEVEEKHPDPFPAVLATEHKMSAGTKRTNRAGGKLGRRLTLEEVNELMGMPRDWETPALTIEMAYKVRGNGVPVQLGRAIADAIIRATE